MAIPSATITSGLVMPMKPSTVRIVAFGMFEGLVRRARTIEAAARDGEE